MDWAGWAVCGVMATSLLTGVLIVAQLDGLTRLDLPADAPAQLFGASRKWTLSFH